MANFRDGYLDTKSEFGKLSSVVQLVADNQAVVLGDLQGLLRLTSDNTTAANRTFTITNGNVEGQVLVIILESGSSTTCQLANSGNCKLVAEWLPTQWNAIQLMWNGTFWVEANRDTGGDSQGAAVTNIGSFSNLTLANPTAAAQGVTYDQTDINTALDLKADNAKVVTMIGTLNTDLSAVYTKIDALLTSLRNAGIIAP